MRLLNHLIMIVLSLKVRYSCYYILVIYTINISTRLCTKIVSVFKDK